MHTPQVVRRGLLLDADLLQVTYGCPWGKCHFCNLYEHEQFGVVPLAHIVEDLDEIAATRRHPRAVQLLGGNPLGLPNSKLAPETEVIHEAATFIENLGCETIIWGSHDSNLFKVDGALPRNREGMVATLRWRAEHTDDAAFAGLRLRMRGM